MNLLKSGVAAPVIALWLGHEDPATTHQYIEADLLMKEQALQRLQPPKERRTRSGNRFVGRFFGPARAYLSAAENARSGAAFDPKVVFAKAAFTPDGERILRVSGSNAVLNVIRGPAANRVFAGHQEAVGLSADGFVAFTGARDNRLLLWPVSNDRGSRRLDHHTNVYCVDIARDCSMALTGGGDRNVILWDLNTASQIRSFTGHEKQIRSVAFSADGKFVLSGSDDATAWPASILRIIGRMSPRVPPTAAASVRTRVRRSWAIEIRPVYDRGTHDRTVTVSNQRAVLASIERPGSRGPRRS